MQQSEALAFANQWATEWSRRDVMAVLDHFADEVRFTSPLADKVVGTSTVVGKAALADYWQLALTQIKSLAFAVDFVLFDPQTQQLAIVYISQTETRTVRATEIMQFGDNGKIIEAEAFYGAPVSLNDYEGIKTK